MIYAVVLYCCTVLCTVPYRCRRLMVYYLLLSVRELDVEATGLVTAVEVRVRSEITGEEAARLGLLDDDNHTETAESPPDGIISPRSTHPLARSRTLGKNLGPDSLNSTRHGLRPSCWPPCIAGER